MFTAVAAVLLTSSHIEAQATAENLEGAWRVAEVVRTGPGGGTLASPQPGLLLFTGRHYSYTFVTSAESRPQLPGGVVDAAALAAIWNPLTANAGTFEVSGDTMIRRPLVAKSPAAMAPGAFNEYTFRLSADTLWVTTVGTETGPSRNPTTVRYLRVR